MHTFAGIAAGRRELAALASGLTAEQRATPSLCRGGDGLATLRDRLA